MTRLRIIMLTLVPLAAFACNDGDEPAGADAAMATEPDAAAPRQHGDACEGSAQCRDGFCVEGACAAMCQPADINSCTSYDALCIAFGAAPGACLGGPLLLGDDLDDNRILAMSEAVELEASAGDGDLLKLGLAPERTAGIISVLPDDGLDVSVEVFGAQAELVRTIDTNPAGQAEVAELSLEGPAPYLFVVVRNNGDVAGRYRVEWSPPEGDLP